MSLKTFRGSLSQGKIGESLIANWLKRKGCHILPVYDTDVGSFKGPTLFTAEGKELIAPDILAFNDKKVIWIEAKHKDAFTWHRITERFCTGIDLKHYFEYQEVNNLVKWPVYILFLHRGGIAKDSKQSPSGLYGDNIENLKNLENHRSDKWGKDGMVYWAEKDLKKIAEYEEVKNYKSIINI